MARLGVPIHVAEIVVNHRPAQSLKGVARVYTPKNFDLTAILADILDIVERGSQEAA